MIDKIGEVEATKKDFLSISFNSSSVFDQSICYNQFNYKFIINTKIEDLQ